jgi:riboflavin transporter FmnP
LEDLVIDRRILLKSEIRYLPVVLLYLRIGFGDGAVVNTVMNIWGP